MCIRDRPYLQNCLQHGRYCDVIFQCKDGVTVGAHKIVLVTASHNLYQLFLQSGETPVTVILPGVEGGTMRAFCRMLYGEQGTVGGEVRKEMFDISSLLGIDITKNGEYRPQNATAKDLQIKRLLDNNASFFPNEIWEMIIMNMDPKSKKNMSLVSKRMRDLSLIHI